MSLKHLGFMGLLIFAVGCPQEVPPPGDGEKTKEKEQEVVYLDAGQNETPPADVDAGTQTGDSVDAGNSQMGLDSGSTQEIPSTDAGASEVTDAGPAVPPESDSGTASGAIEDAGAGQESQNSDAGQTQSNNGLDAGAESPAYDGGFLEDAGPFFVSRMIPNIWDQTIPDYDGGISDGLNDNWGPSSAGNGISCRDPYTECIAGSGTKQCCHSTKEECNSGSNYAICSVATFENTEDGETACTELYGPKTSKYCSGSKQNICCSADDECVEWGGRAFCNKNCPTNTTACSNENWPFDNATDCCLPGNCGGLPWASTCTTKYHNCTNEYPCSVACVERQGFYQCAYKNASVCPAETHWCEGDLLNLCCPANSVCVNETADTNNNGIPDGEATCIYAAHGDLNRVLCDPANEDDCSSWGRCLNTSLDTPVLEWHVGTCVGTMPGDPDNFHYCEWNPQAVPCEGGGCTGGYCF